MLTIRFDNLDFDLTEDTRDAFGMYLLERLDDEDVDDVEMRVCAKERWIEVEFPQGWLGHRVPPMNLKLGPPPDAQGYHWHEFDPSIWGLWTLADDDDPADDWKRGER